MTDHFTTPARKSTRRARRPRSAAVVLAVLATAWGLAGCNASSVAGGGSAAPYPDAEACAWLAENLPTVPDSEIGAQAQLTIGLSTFFEDHGGLEHADAYALDDAFSRGCAELHGQALKKAGIKTFGNL